MPETREQTRERQREWTLKNKEHVAEKKRQWYLQNKERLLKTMAVRYQANKETILKKSEVYRKSHGAVKKKLRRHREEDLHKGREFNITYEYVKDLLVEQDNECAQCYTEVKLSWTKNYDPAQFSINRIKNKYGHIVGNVEICCLQCNRTYRSK